MPALTNKKNPQPLDERFDWDLFADGRQRTCRRGVDFRCSLTTFQQRARHAARRRGFRAVTWQEPDKDSVVIEFQQPYRKPIKRTKPTKPSGH